MGDLNLHVRTLETMKLILCVCDNLLVSEISHYKMLLNIHINRTVTVFEIFIVQLCDIEILID